jgi:hypothetical protein
MGLIMTRSYMKKNLKPGKIHFRMKSEDWFLEALPGPHITPGVSFVKLLCRKIGADHEKPT